MLLYKLYLIVIPALCWCCTADTQMMVAGFKYQVVSDSYLQVTWHDACATGITRL